MRKALTTQMVTLGKVFKWQDDIAYGKVFKWLDRPQPRDWAYVIEMGLGLDREEPI